MDVSSPGNVFLTNSVGATSPRPSQERASEDDLRAAADGFESLFVTMMLKAGRAASFGDELTGGSGVEMAQGLFDMKVAEVTSNRTNLGISDAIYRQFSPTVRPYR